MFNSNRCSLNDAITFIMYMICTIYTMHYESLCRKMCTFAFACEEWRSLLKKKKIKNMHIKSPLLCISVKTLKNGHPYSIYGLLACNEQWKCTKCGRFQRILFLSIKRHNVNVAHSECIILTHCPTLPSFQTKRTIFFESVNYCDPKNRWNDKYITIRVLFRLFRANNWVEQQLSIIL